VEIRMLIETRELTDEEKIESPDLPPAYGVYKYFHVFLDSNGKRVWVRARTERVEDDDFWKGYYKRIDL
jgi:hypothetical protein